MNTQKLRELALCATQRNWVHFYDDEKFEYAIRTEFTDGAAWQIGIADNEDDAEYIAAACPANILALLDSHADLLDIANECHKIIKELCACYSHHEPLATLERIEAITKAEAL
jgi:hypothetical protein